MNTRRNSLIFDLCLLAWGISIGIPVGVIMLKQRQYENRVITDARFDQCMGRLVKTDRIVRTIWSDWAPDTEGME